jgi:hypothetical protein
MMKASCRSLCGLDAFSTTDYENQCFVGLASFSTTEYEKWFVVLF